MLQNSFYPLFHIINRTNLHKEAKPKEPQWAEQAPEETDEQPICVYHQFFVRSSSQENSQKFLSYPGRRAVPWPPERPEKDCRYAPAAVQWFSPSLEGPEEIRLLWMRKFDAISCLGLGWGKGRGHMFLTHLLNRLHRNFGKNLCFSWLDLRMHGLQSTRPQKVHFLFRGIRSHLEWWSLRSLYAKTSLLCFWIIGAGWSQEGQGNKNPLATLCTNRHQCTADNLTPYPKQYYYVYIYIYSALSLSLFLCPILSILQPLFLSIIPSPFLLCPLSFALSFPPSCCLSISLSLSLYMALSLSLPVSLSPSLSSLVSCSLCFSLSLFLSSVSVCPSLFPLPLSGCCITLGCIGSKKLVVHPAPEGEKQSRVRSSAAEGCSVLSGSEGTMATIRKMICSTEYLVNCLRHPRGQPKAGAWH